MVSQEVIQTAIMDYFAANNALDVERYYVDPAPVLALFA
jgi:hypothetical protein